ARGELKGGREWRERDDGDSRTWNDRSTTTTRWYPVEVYEEHYRATHDPRRQSGFGGDEERWEAARRPIVEAIGRDGSFLDVGCANGYLLESIVRWSEHDVDPHGLDFSARLVEL